MPSSQRPEYELVPPDGGWGWMVVLGVAMNYVTGVSQVYVFSIVVRDKLISMGHETTSVVVIMNITTAVFSFSGLFTGPLMKKFSSRQVAFAGGVSISTGLMLSSFANSLVHIIITFGILVGFGLSLVLSSTFLAVKTYFVASRGRALGLAMAGGTCGQLAMPYLVLLLLDTYSFSSTLLVMAALALLGPAGALLFHPLERHAERRPVVYEMQPVQGGSEDPEARENSGAALSVCDERGPKIVTDSDTQQQRPQSCCRRVVAFMDLGLLGSCRFLNVTLATAIVTMANANFSMLLPDVLMSHEVLAMRDLSLCFTLTAVGDLAARLAVPSVLDRLKMRPRRAFLLAVLFLAATRSALTGSCGVPSLYVWCWLCGFGSGVVNVYSYLCVAEVAPDRKLPAAVGLNLLFNGLLSLSLGPLLGYIRDKTKNYPLCVNILSILICATMVSWCVEWAVRRYLRKRRLTDA